jgi:hypothetical protein
MSGSNLYTLSKRQIELEFQAETQDARMRRQAKLDMLEQLRSTLEKALANAASAEQKAEPSTPRPSVSESMSQRIKYELATLQDHEQITMPDIYARLLSKYEDVRHMKPGNVRSLIATILKKMRDEQRLFLFVKGKSNEPNIYTRTPLIVDNESGIFAAHLEHPNGNFVLRDAVREVIRDFHGKPFQFRDMLTTLKKRHPNEIPKKREASVSATVARLLTRNEVEKTGLRNGKVMYRATESGGLV